MANITSIITTIKRPDVNTPWVQSDITDKTNFTDEEYNNVILPYWQWIANQEGFISVTVTFPDELTKVTTYKFDTTQKDTANLAWKLVSNKDGNNTQQSPISKAKNDLIKLKTPAGFSNGVLEFVTTTE